MREFTARGAAEILQAICRRFRIEERENTERRTGHRDERAVAMEMLYRHGQLSQAVIGKIMGGLDYTTVSRERKRLRDSAQTNKRLGAAMTEIEECLRHK